LAIYLRGGFEAVQDPSEAATDGRRPVPFLVATWAYSNAPFVLALPFERTEAILHGMVAAFEFFGAVAKEVAGCQQCIAGDRRPRIGPGRGSGNRYRVIDAPAMPVLDVSRPPARPWLGPSAFRRAANLASGPEITFRHQFSCAGSMRSETNDHRPRNLPHPTRGVLLSPVPTIA
jgi:hypothetical protein